MPARPAPDAAAHASAPVRVVERGDPEFPAPLLELAAPPARVWIAGRLALDVPRVAIVGARAATLYGLDHARRLAGDLARLGITVVSGLARGIDTAAHRGALDQGGVTIAVLPFPLGAIPAGEPRRLAARIAERGALLGERAPGAPVFPSVFVERNRLIAALAHAVVVVEAAEHSGSLSTAAAARKLGRPRLAVPGDVDRVTSRGTLQLLREGARPCADASDVLANLAMGEGLAPAAAAFAPRPGPAAPAPAAGTHAARLAAALDAHARTVDELATRAGLGVSAALATLLELEWAGLACRAPGARWRRGAA